MRAGGHKSLALAQMGYRVTGSDISDFAVARAGALAAKMGMDVRFFVAAWQDPLRIVPGTYDCIVNDALVWCPTYDQLQCAAVQYARLLKPGGCVLFQGGDQWEDAAQRPHPVRQWASKARRQPRAIADGPHSHDDIRMIHVTANSPLADEASKLFTPYVIEHDGALTVETADMVRLFRWNWKDYVDAFRSAGFRDLCSRRITLEGKERVYNVAIL